MKSCPFCKAPIDETRVEHLHRWEGKLYVFRNVPADVCRQCGEVFFGPGTLETMDQVVMREHTPEEHLSVPVHSL